MQTVLVTGGLGYIGSHTAVALGKTGHNVVIIDNLSNSKFETLAKIESLIGKKVAFIQADLSHEGAADIPFSNYPIDTVIHMAGLKAVAESILEPLRYYDVNINITLRLLEAMKRYDCKRIIFSSSATVYGTSSSPLTEESPTGIGISNPYGRTKYMIENILQDLTIADPNMHVTTLRYFNPISNHESKLIKEDPNGIPNNLFPIIMRTYHGKQDKLKIYGNDYETPDGTCIRDFIHVMDLAEAHEAALHHMKRGFHVYNIGTGRGTSVAELIENFEKASGKELNKEYVERRIGDIPVTFAQVNKANKELNWKAKRTVSDCCNNSI